MVLAMDNLQRVLAGVPTRIVACSGGIDSLLLSTLAHRAAPTATTIAHTVTPAVPGAGTARVMAFAEREGWRLEIVRSMEFDDENYLSNPTNRCYHCKTSLYDAVAGLQTLRLSLESSVILSGANTDDLGEYRPGLIAADEHQVRHPYIEAGWSKDGIRRAAKDLGLAEADLPASPCLASRLYTGTRVTAARLQAVEAGEALITELTGIRVVRCRVRELHVLVEVAVPDRQLVTTDVLEAVTRAMQTIEPSIASVRLDDREYRPGRAILQIN